MLIGALAGLGIICFFVFSVDHPNPEWPQYWRVKPLLVTPLAGAIGILSFYLKPIVAPKNLLLNALVMFCQRAGICHCTLDGGCPRPERNPVELITNLFGKLSLPFRKGRGSPGQFVAATFPLIE